MSEPVAKERPDIDFDEFERHYRQQDHQRRDHGHQDLGRQNLGGEDPLAELARLVGQHHDPYGDVFADQKIAREAAVEYEAYERERRHEPTFGKSAGLSPRLSGDFASIEAGLRGAASSQTQAHHEHDYYGAHEPQLDQAYAHDQSYAEDPAYREEAYPHDQAYLQDHEAQQWGAEPQDPSVAESAKKSRKPVYAMIATIAIGVIGVGAAFAYKGSSSSPREIKTIAAASGPTKVQPPADTASSDQAGQDSAMLNKGQQPAPSQLVSREEQPVDISSAVQENASKNADAGTAPGDASNVPVPPSPTMAQGAAGTSASPSPADPIGSFGMSGMPSPKKVKVVSVRPDGSIMPSDTPSVAALPLSPSATSSDKPSTPVAKPATPKAAASTPKTTSRASNKPAKVASADDSADDAAPAPKPAKKSKKPQRVATAEPTGDSEPTATTAPAKTGGFAVQLAAPGSEADAKSATSRLGKKYADALGGRKLGFRKAESNGKSVYRVRVGGMSKEEAQSLCEKLKSDGGSCFVAKN